MSVRCEVWIWSSKDAKIKSKVSKQQGDLKLLVIYKCWYEMLISTFKTEQDNLEDKLKKNFFSGFWIQKNTSALKKKKKSLILSVLDLSSFIWFTLSVQQTSSLSLA